MGKVRLVLADDVGEFELPPGHMFGMKVPKGGSSCAKCKFLSEDKKHCGSNYFRLWRESLGVENPSEIPAPADEYCCDVFTATKVARRFTAEMLTKQWLMAVRRGWVSLMKPSIQDYSDVVKAIDRLDTFVSNLRDQVLNVRRGPYTSAPTMTHGQELEEALKSLKDQIADVRTSVTHWKRCYDGTNLSDCRKDGEHMLNLYRTNFESATARSKKRRGGGGLVREAPLTEFFDDVMEVLYADAKRLRDYEEKNPDQPYEKTTPVFKEFSFGKMKIVVVDPKTNGSAIERYVKYVDRSKQLIDKRGFSKVWYGVLFLMSGEYKELKDWEKADYERAGYKDLQSVAGTFHSGRDVVEITAPAEEELVKTVCHELGHRYWFKVMNQEKRARFKQFLDEGVLPVSHYGETNAVEAFAEVFAWYCLGADLDQDQLESFRAVLSSKLAVFLVTLEQ